MRRPHLHEPAPLATYRRVARLDLRLLKLFYDIAPNYGVAIILLTVMVRLLTLPMSIKGQR